MLFTFIKKASFIAFYDNEKFVDLAYIVHFKGECYVFYLATEKRIRGGGCGSRILEWIKENNRGMSIILDVEALAEGAPNAFERIKRIEFYRRNGILDTGYTLMDNVIKYMALSSAPPCFNQIIW